MGNVKKADKWPGSKSPRWFENLGLSLEKHVLLEFIQGTGKVGLCTKRDPRQG